MNFDILTSDEAPSPRTRNYLTLGGAPLMLRAVRFVSIPACCCQACCFTLSRTC